MYERVKAHKKRTVGASATMRALQKDELTEVYVADDADSRVVQPVIVACHNIGIPVSHVDSQSLLGKACGLSVGASAVGLIR